ncbi:MAG: peptidylprolyl isomerase [Gemmatimonadaceae bacterium]
MKSLLPALLLAVSAVDGSSQQPAAPGNGPSGGGLQVDRIVAVVGNKPILWSDVMENMNTLAAQGQRVPTDSAGLLELAREVVARLVDEELLVQKALQDTSIRITDFELVPGVDDHVKKVRARYQTEVEFRDQLKSAGFGNPEEFRRWVTEEQRRAALQQNLIEKMRRDGKIVPAPVSEKDVTEFFTQSQGQLPRLPATVTFRQIVIAPKPSDAAHEAARLKAESLLVEIKAGGNFEQIAKRETMDASTKEIGGDLGWRRRGEFVPAFEQWAFRLPPGEMSPVVRTNFGYHIIKVDRVQPAEAKVRHILIRPRIDSVNIAAARAEADSVVTAWRAGVSYDTLVAKHHDPDEEKLIPQAFPKAQLPEAYQKAFEGKAANDIVDPFPIEDQTRGVPKLVVAQLMDVQEEREATITDFRERIRQQLAQERAIRRFLDGLRKETFVSVRL